MAILISASFIGLMLGTVYALMAFGIVACYRISRVVNLGIAGIAAWCAGAYWWMADKWGAPLVVALIVAILIGTAMGGLLGVMVVRMKRWPVGLLMIITLSVSLLLFWQSDTWLPSFNPTVPSPFGEGGFSLFYAQVNWSDVGTFLTCLLVVGLLTVLMRMTRFGLFTRAIYDDPPGAATLGIPFNVAVVGMWALGGALAALGGVLVTHRSLLQSDLLLFIAVWGLAAATLGGLESFVLAFVGGLSLGIAEGVVGGDFGSSLPPGVENLASVAVMAAAVLYAGIKRRGQITEVTA
ncbi:MAG: livH-3 [Chloroflexi bacterium]|nr:livH-3 [Chloroflexota bacterium]